MKTLATSEVILFTFVSILCILVIILIFQIFRLKTRGFQIKVDEQEMKQIINQAIEDKMKGSTLTGQKKKKSFERALVVDVLNQYTNGLFFGLQKLYPTFAKKVIKEAADLIDLETGEVNPLLDGWIDTIISKIPLGSIIDKEKKTDEGFR